MSLPSLGDDDFRFERGWAEGALCPCSPPRALLFAAAQGSPQPSASSLGPDDAAWAVAELSDVGAFVGGACFDGAG